jgi:hypothetical protein
MRDSSPFISSVARREIVRTCQVQRRILWVQFALLLAQSVIIVLLVFR